MRFFDVHCDTIQKIYDKKGEFTTAGSLHVTLPAMLEVGVCAQVFASCVLSEQYEGREFEVALDMVDSLRSLTQAHNEHLTFADSGKEISSACTSGGRIAVIAGLEGAAPLMGEVEKIRPFFQAGVRILTIAWSDNPFCGSVFGSGSGLTEKGHDLVTLCEEMGIMIDMSHASDRAFEDVRSIVKKPIIASHSNCRSVCPNPRNLTDEMIRVLGDLGGVMGINMGSGFLSPEFFDREKGVRDEFFRTVNSGEKSFDEALEISRIALVKIPRPSMELVLTHVKRAIEVGGVDCVGLGGDLDGVESMPIGVEGVGDYPQIAELLQRGGLSSRQVDKVCYENFARVFNQVLC